MTYLLQITEANHTENQFFTLGGAGFDTEAERQANLATIPAFEHDCDAGDRCYILDILDPDDEFSVVDDFEISESTAHRLLGVEDFEPLRAQERALFEAASKVAG
jgi:hypothetical protein